MPWRVWARAVGRGVVLGQRPDRRLGVLDQSAGLAPGLDRLGGLRIWVAAGLLRAARAVGLWQIDRDSVVGRALEQLRPLISVDHVIRRRRDVLQRSDHAEVVVEGVERSHVGHSRES